MTQQVLYRAVLQLAAATGELPDKALNREWVWDDHSEDMRIVFFGTYQELRTLAIELRVGRATAGDPPSKTQQVLAQYHAAYRDLQAVLLGVADADLDRPPAEGEWPLREVLRHIIDADQTFFGLVHQAVRRARAGLDPGPLARKELRALVGPRKKFKELMKGSDLAGILAYYEAHHNRVLEETAGWGDADLAALSPFWEKAPKTVHYRLHRFGAHLRQHTVQAEKTLIAIGRPASEVKKLLRLVFNALAEAEGAIIGAGDFGREQIQGLGERIVVRAEKVHG